MQKTSAGALKLTIAICLFGCGSLGYAIGLGVADQLFGGPPPLFIPLPSARLNFVLTLQPGESISLGDILEFQMDLQNAGPAEFFHQLRPFPFRLDQGPVCPIGVLCGISLFCGPTILESCGLPPGYPRVFSCTRTDTPIPGRMVRIMPNGKACQQALVPDEPHRNFFFFFAYTDPSASPLLPFTTNNSCDIGYFETGFFARLSSPPYASITLPTVTLYDQNRNVKYSTTASFANGARPPGAPVPGACVP